MKPLKKVDSRNIRRIKPANMYLKKPYKTAVVVIDKDNIDRFVRPEWHRNFREAHITSIMKSLKNAVHFSENITCNYTNEHYVVINGNHRIEAVRRITHDYPEFKVQCTVTAYKDLDLDEERKLYTIINTVKAETTDDFIRAHCYDSPVMKLMEAFFPVKVGFYKRAPSNANYVHLGTLVRPYLLRLSKNITRGIGRQEFVDSIKRMKEEDYDRMKDFAEWFLKYFGKMNSKNQYAEYSLFTIIAKIYYTETLFGIGDEALGKRFQHLMVTMPQLFQRRSTNFKDQEFWYYDIIRALNTVRKDKQGDLINIREQLKDGKIIKGDKR